MEEAPGAMAVSRRSSWNLVSGDLESVVVVGLDDGSGESDPGSLVVLDAGPESGYCEISVEFQEHSCTVSNISIISSARQYEIYSFLEPGGDAEYVGTARGELEDEGDGALYEAEVELVDSDPWAGVRIRLLSLSDKSRVSLKKMRIVGAPGPLIVKEEENRSSSNANLLKMMMPGVLDMLRSMPSRKSDTIEAAPSRSCDPVSRQSDEIPRAREDAPKAPAPGVTSQQQTLERERDESFRDGVMAKLQGLEAAVGGIELFLREAFRKVDVRLETLENQMLQVQTAAFKKVDGRLDVLESHLSELRVQSSSSSEVPEINEDSTLKNPPEQTVASEDEALKNPSVASEDEVQEVPVADHEAEEELKLPKKSSLSLESVWSSSLAAFSSLKIDEKLQPLSQNCVEVKDKATQANDPEEAVVWPRSGVEFQAEQDEVLAVVSETEVEEHEVEAVVSETRVEEDEVPSPAVFDPSTELAGEDGAEDLKAEEGSPEQSTGSPEESSNNNLCELTSEATPGASASDKESHPDLIDWSGDALCSSSEYHALNESEAISLIDSPTEAGTS